MPAEFESMSRYERPQDIARGFAQERARRRLTRSDSYRRETFSLPREAAREKAREMFRRFPKAGAFAAMLGAVGFARVAFRAMSGGIVTLHSGWRL